jgi:hypothetical protein
MHLQPERQPERQLKCHVPGLTHTHTHTHIHIHTQTHTCQRAIQCEDKSAIRLHALL